MMIEWFIALHIFVTPIPNKDVQIYYPMLGVYYKSEKECERSRKQFQLDLDFMLNDMGGNEQLHMEAECNWRSIYPQ